MVATSASRRVGREGLLSIKKKLASLISCKPCGLYNIFTGYQIVHLAMLYAKNILDSALFWASKYDAVDPITVYSLKTFVRLFLRGGGVVKQKDLLRTILELPRARCQSICRSTQMLGARRANVAPDWLLSPLYPGA